MTPQLQQAIRLLQLSRLELVDAIQAEIEQNPVLEEAVRPEVSNLEEEAKMTGEEPKVAELSAPPDKQLEVETGGANATKEIDWDQWLENYNSTPSTPSGIRRD